MSRCIGRREQDDDEAVAWTFYWGADLNNSTLAAVSWNIPSALTTETTSNDATTSSFRVSGGTPGQTYKIECSVTSAAGEDLQAHMLLTITD